MFRKKKFRTLGSDDIYTRKFGTPDFCGFMRMRGGRFGGSKKRWFQLIGTQLLYFSPKNKTEPRGTIITHSRIRITGNDKKQTITLEGGNLRKGYRFQVKKKDEYFGWLEALRKSCRSGRRRRRAFKGKKMFSKTVSDPSANMAFLEKLYEYLLIHGKDVGGIFRKPGNKDDIQNLMHVIEQGRFEEGIEKYEVFVIADVLKVYFGKLPEPLIPHSFYPKYVELAEEHFANDDENDFSEIECFSVDAAEEKERSTAVRELILESFSENKTYYKILKSLLLFLHRFSKFKEITQMGPKNLSIVFTPNLLRPKTVDIAYGKALMKFVRLMDYIILGFPHFFREEDMLSEEERAKWEAERAKEKKLDEDAPNLDNEVITKIKLRKKKKRRSLLSFRRKPKDKKKKKAKSKRKKKVWSFKRQKNEDEMVEKVQELIAQKEKKDKKKKLKKKKKALSDDENDVDEVMSSGDESVPPEEEEVVEDTTVPKEEEEEEEMKEVDGELDELTKRKIEIENRMKMIEQRLKQIDADSAESEDVAKKMKSGKKAPPPRPSKRPKLPPGGAKRSPQINRILKGKRALIRRQSLRLELAKNPAIRRFYVSSKIIQTWTEVIENAKAFSWCCALYLDSFSVYLSRKGKGLDSLKSYLNIQRDICFLGIALVVEVDGEEQVVNFLISYCPPHVPAQRREKMKLHRTKIKDVLDDVQNVLHISLKNQLKMELLEMKIAEMYKEKEYKLLI